MVVVVMVMVVLVVVIVLVVMLGVVVGLCHLYSSHSLLEEGVVVAPVLSTPLPHDLYHHKRYNSHSFKEDE